MEVLTAFILTVCRREEQQPLEDFFRAKNIRTKNDMADDVSHASSLVAIT